MAQIRAQVVLQGFTNKVEDRYVNTFHFFNGDTFAAHAAAVSTALNAFYNGTASGGTTGPSSNIAALVSRTATINCYDLTTAEPRIPTTTTMTLLTAVTTLNFPQELAVVLSFRGVLPISPRRRGRIFFGPLVGHSDVIAYGSATAFPTVGSIIRQRLVEHAKDLRNNGAVGWVIASQTPVLNYVPVDAGYVDDSWDIQRRRGNETTLRTPFSATTP